MCSTKRVLPQPVGPFSITASRRAWHCSKIATSSPDGQVVRLARPACGAQRRVRSAAMPAFTHWRRAAAAAALGFWLVVHLEARRVAEEVDR